MGVKGLWQLFDAFGVITSPERWSGCRVAIDASIWITQFRSQTSSKNRGNRIIEGFFLRILKLMFYGIEPIIVFDGRTSSLKAKEHQKRQALRNALDKSSIKRRAQELVSALIASEKLKMSELKQKRESAGESSRTEKLERWEPRGEGNGETFSEPIHLSYLDAPQNRKENEPFREEKSNDTNVSSQRVVHKRPCHLNPEYFSKTATLCFLKQTEKLARVHSEAVHCALKNTLRYSSSSLFMGPRYVLQSREAKDRSATSKRVDRDGAQHVTIIDDDNLLQQDDFLSVDSDEDSSEIELISPKIISLSAEDNDETFIVPHLVDCNVRENSDKVCSSDRHIASNHYHDDVSLVFDVDHTLNSFSAETKKCIFVKNTLSHRSLSEQNSVDPKERFSESSTSISFDDYTFQSSSDFNEYSRRDKEIQERLSLQQMTQREFKNSESIRRIATDITPRLSTEEDSSNNLENDFEQVNLPLFEKALDNFNAIPVCENLREPMRLSQSVRLDHVLREESVLEKCDVMASKCKNSPRTDSFPSEPVIAHEDSSLSPKHCRLSQSFSPPMVSNTCPNSERNLTFSADNPSGNYHTKTVPFELVEIVNLLNCFQIPYLISPSEADAQCAYLASKGLVDAVFTEDSDVLVHGAPVVLRGFFSSTKKVVAYRQSDLEGSGIDKRVLVALAILMGCDYTEGITGLGLIGALEVIVSCWRSIKDNEEDKANNPSKEIAFIIDILSRWKCLVKKKPGLWKEAGDNDLTLLQLLLFHRKKLIWNCLTLPEAFPEYSVAEIFYKSPVDLDCTPFSASNPQWQQVWNFAAVNGLLESPWVQQRLELAQKEWHRRKEQHAALIRDGGVGSAPSHLEKFGFKVQKHCSYNKKSLRLSTLLDQLTEIRKIGTDIR